MNSYEAKQEARRERYEELAAKNEAAAAARFNTAHKITEMIPFGQPILVGHHSEGRHRRDIARSDSNMRSGVDARKKAQYYADKAAGVGNAGISSDDPEALDKLREKLAGLEANHELMKTANKIIKQHGGGKRQAVPEEQTAACIEALMAAGLPRKIAAQILVPDFMKRVGFADYAISNSNGNLGNVRRRIADLEAREAERVAALAAAEETDEDAANPSKEYEGVTLVENLDENRIQFVFDGKPPAETRQILKSNGFRWAPSQGAWQRQLNGNGQFAAKMVLHTLGLEIVEAWAR